MTNKKDVFKDNIEKKNILKKSLKFLVGYFE